MRVLVNGVIYDSTKTPIVYDSLIQYIYSTNNWFTINDLINEFDYNKRELKSVLEKLKDIDFIIQVGSKYLLKKNMNKL